MKKKFFLLALITLIVVLTMLVFAQFAFATVTEGGTTGPQTSGGTGTTATGAPVLILSGLGSAMVGAGYLLRRRSSK